MAEDDDVRSASRALMRRMEPKIRRDLDAMSRVVGTMKLGGVEYVVLTTKEYLRLNALSKPVAKKPARKKK